MDFAVVGGGFLGLSFAKELKKRHPDARVAVFEKETSLGAHASGRNSGVLHSGIYYPEGSLKARLCAQGARAWTAYCDERKLAILKCGKLILPTREEEDPQLDLLAKRARANGATVEVVSGSAIRELEPEARSPSGRALWCPDTSVVEPKAILNHFAGEIRADGVDIRMGSPVDAIDPDKKTLTVGSETFSFGTLINCAGAYADRIAAPFGAGERYALLPFRGHYWNLAPETARKIRHLIYPVPDLRIPFLGVHVTPHPDGTVTLGPSAVPAWGRENYQGIRGVRFGETLENLTRIAGLYLSGRQGFRGYTHREASRLLKSRFARAVRALVPSIRTGDLRHCDKVGIRPQLYDRDKGELVLDFVVEHSPGAIHVLNAVSPAFTSAPAFVPYVLDHKK